ncbi:MAG: molybdopterin-dependent oxidoreductase [Myxococcales bacterium]|nr:molybdopterin-dependent oxidoreductase [Myxococcales bacterium]
MPDTSRRSFLSLTAGTLAAAMAQRFLPTGPARGLPYSNDPGTDGRLVRSVCEVCFWKCGIQAHVQGEHITKIQGNPLHPLSNGMLCPRGTGGAGLAHDPDRLVKPLLRVGARGSESFRPVSWDEALGFIADKWKSIRDKYGPESVALFNHGAGASWYRHLVSAWGSPNIAAPSFSQCRGPRDVGFDLTFGADPGSPEVLDIQHSKCLVLIGSHLGENMHNTQVQEFAEMVSRGGDLIVVDPRFSVAASKARTWMPIRPGTDTALLLAWIHVLVTEKRHQREYVEQFATGLDELAAHVAAFSPEWAAAETGLDPHMIRETARRMAGAAPATIIHPGRHTTWYGPADLHRVRAMAILNALLGSWGHRGGFFVANSMKAAPYPTPKYPQTRGPADRLPGEAPLALEALTQGIRRATLDGKPYPIRSWLVYGTNLIHALPQRAETLKAIQALDLLVVVDVLPAEIASYADVVLPEASYLERYDDLIAVKWRRGGIALRQPAVPPPGDAKPGWWITKELAKKLDLSAFFPWDDIEGYLRERCRLSNIDFEKLKTDGVVLAPEKPTTIEDGLALSFATESGKIELVSERLKRLGQPALPVYERPVEAPPGFFRLLYGRAPGQTFGRTANNRQLGELSHGDRVWLNAKVARDMGIADGDLVRLVNQDGVKSNRVAVKVTERIRNDCVFMPHGWGHTAKGLRYAVGKGADDSELITHAPACPVMGGTGMRGNFVALQREV